MSIEQAAAELQKIVDMMVKQSKEGAAKTTTVGEAFRTVGNTFEVNHSGDLVLRESAADRAAEFEANVKVWESLGLPRRGAEAAAMGRPEERW